VQIDILEGLLKIASMPNDKYLGEIINNKFHIMILNSNLEWDTNLIVHVTKLCGNICYYENPNSHYSMAEVS